MRADGKRRYRDMPRTRKKNELKKADMGTLRVVGDRTTERFMCVESGIPGRFAEDCAGSQNPHTSDEASQRTWSEGG